MIRVFAFSLASLLVVSLSAAARAHADDGSGAETGSESAPEASADQAADGFARKVFSAGKGAYEIGNYRDALAYFQQAYEISGRSQLLYNIGQAADHLRLDQTALKAFKLYLEKLPAAENRQEVEERVRVLEGVVAEREATPQEEPVDAPPPSAASTRPVTAVPTAAMTSSSGPRQDEPGLLSQWWLWAGVGAAAAIVVVTVLVIGGGTTTTERPDVTGTNGKATATLVVGL